MIEENRPSAYEVPLVLEFSFNNVLGKVKLNAILDTVSDETMGSPAILGRDFTSLSNLTLTISNDLKINNNTDNSIKPKDICSVDVDHVNQLMLIHIDNDTDNSIKPKDICSVDVDHVNQLMLIHIDNDCKPSNKDSLNINSSIDRETQSKIANLIENYLDEPKPEIPEVKFECTLSVKTSEPFAFRPRKLSYSEKGKLQEILDDLLKRKVIRESYSPYCSPIVLLKKKNGLDYRLCVDFRELNKITERIVKEKEWIRLQTLCRFSRIEQNYGTRSLSLTLD
ncbi:hypothetical protein QE152_g7549 [Popillia japonica]|uniref:Polyprotein n=1 Tax=Popillia japonica TaxID=7064 RepID=A0AAW1MFX8_POPJA